MNASSQIILERLVRSDTATAFNITARDVNVTGITQIQRRVLLVNVTATLGVDLPTNSSQEDIAAQLAVKNLSADDAIDMLASQPDKFLGRTTKVTPPPCHFCPTKNAISSRLCKSPAVLMLMRLRLLRDITALNFATCHPAFMIMTVCGSLAGVGCDGGARDCTADAQRKPPAGRWRR